MASGDHYECPKITFDHIFRHFGSIRNLFFPQNGRQWLFWMLENHFFSDQYATFFWICSQNGCRWPFRIPINISDISDKYATFICFLNCFSTWQVAAILLGIFSSQLIGTFLPARSMAKSNMKLMGAFGQSYGMHKLFHHIFFLQNGRHRPFWCSDFFHSGSSKAVSNMNFIEWALVSQLRENTRFWRVAETAVGLKT